VTNKPGLFPDRVTYPFKKPYVDSSVFVAHIKGEINPAAKNMTRVQITTGVMGDAEDGKFSLITSSSTLAEVRRIKDRTEQLTPDEVIKIKEFFGRFLQHEWIFLADVTRQIGELAQDYGRLWDIAPIDSIHLATAVTLKCDVMLVWDKKFTRALPGDVIDGVHVMEPFWEGLELMPSAGT